MYDTLSIPGPVTVLGTMGARRLLRGMNTPAR